MRKEKSTGKTDAINKAVQMLLAVITLPCLMSCGSRAFDRAVKTADSLTEVNQHGALAFIDSINAAGGNKPGRSKSMKLALLKAKAANKLYMPLSDDTLKMLEEYYGSHGTANERMLANYIIGCSFLDKKDAPMALQYFQYAAEKADTTRNDCDYLTLHRIHGQMAELMMNQHAFKYAMDENRLALKYAIKAKDTLNAIISLEQKSNIYNALSVSDSAIYIREKLYGLYSKYGYEKEAVRALGLLINYGVENKKLSDVKHYINLYERKSGKFDNKGNIKKGVEIYYVAKGKYFVEINRLDSAEFYFRKCAKTADNYYDLKYCFEDLAILYKKRNRPDSVAKYADLARMMTDSVYKEMSTGHLQQMQAMYNYNSYKMSAEEAKRETLRTKYISIIIIMVMLAAAISGASSVRMYIMRKRKVRITEKKEYERRMNELERSKKALESINNRLHADASIMITEKTKEIERLQREKNEYIENINMLMTARRELEVLNEKQNLTIKNIIEEQTEEIDKLRIEYEKKFNYVKGKVHFENEPTIMRIRLHARKTFKPIDKDESGRLKELFRGYEALSRWENMLNDNEYLICMLVKLNFVPAEICTLTGLSSSNVSNIRKRLLVKMGGREGSPKDFDKYIKSL